MKNRPARASAGADPGRTTRLHLLLLAGASFVLYAPTLWNGFVYDDNAEVLEDRLLRSFSNIPAFFAHSVWFFLGGKGDRYYRPLKLLAYSAEYHLFHFHAALWHLVNIFAHTAAVLTIYVLVRDLAAWEAVRSREGGALESAAAGRLAFWTGLWFALHAVHVEAVAWVAAGNDLFCGLALIAATWFYHRARTGAPALINYSAAIVSFLAAVLFKETALVFPLLLPAYDLLYRRDSLSEIARAWKRYLAFLVTAGIYLLLRWHAMAGFAPDNPKNLVTTKEMFLTVPVLLAQYVWKTLVPADLRFWYVFEPVRAFGWKPLLALLAALGLIAALVRLRRARPLLAFALAWFLVFLLPVFDIPKLGENVFTERYLYIPTVGFCIFAGWAWLRLRERALRPWMRRAACGGLAAVLAFYAAVVLRRLPDWRDNLHMALRTAEQAPTANNLAEVGYGFYQAGRYQDSIRYSQRAAKLNPKLAQVHNNLGSDFLALGRYGEALAEIQKAIELQPDFAPYWTNLAVYHRATGQWKEAIETCRRGLALAPSDHALLTLLGSAQWRDGQHDDAVETYRQAIQSEPDRLDAYLSLATSLYQLGQFDAAVADLYAGLEASPNSAEAYLAHYQLGAIYERQGFQVVAAREFQRASELRPGFAMRVPLRPAPAASAGWKRP